MLDHGFKLSVPLVQSCWCLQRPRTTWWFFFLEASSEGYFRTSGVAQHPNEVCRFSKQVLSQRNRRCERTYLLILGCAHPFPRGRRLVSSRLSGAQKQWSDARLHENPATRNRTRDHLIAATLYSQMLYQLSYSRSDCILTFHAYRAMNLAQA